MYKSGALIPARFLILIAHLTILISVLWGSRMNEISCMGAKPLDEIYKIKELIIGLSLSLGMLGVELLLFLAGLTMFHSTSALLSIFSHSIGSLMLTYFVFNGWLCDWFWWSFVLCSVMPFMTDFCIMFNVFIKGKW